MLAKRVGL